MKRVMAPRHMMPLANSSTGSLATRHLALLSPRMLAASPLPERASSEGAQANVNYVDGEYGEEGDERAEGKIANVINAVEE